MDKEIEILISIKELKNRLITLDSLKESLDLEFNDSISYGDFNTLKHSINCAINKLRIELCKIRGE